MSIKCTADTACNTADNERLLERQQNTVNRRLCDTENTGNKVRDCHFLELLVLGLKEDRQNNRRSCKGAGKERHHNVIVA